MTNRTEIIVSELFEAESEEYLYSIVERRDFVNSGLALLKFLADRNITKKVFVNLLASSPFMNKKADHIRRVLDNWIHNRNRMSRDSAFQICILLRLSLDESKSFFTKIVCEKWVHYRNVKDVIYELCIRHSLSIFIAYDLIGEYGTMNRNANIETKTMVIRNKYLEASNGSDNIIGRVEDFLSENAESFCITRGTLYKYFMDMLLKPNVFCGERHLKYSSKGNLSIDTFYLSGILLETDSCNLSSHNNLKKQKSLRVTLDNFISMKAEISREVFVKCMLICGIDDIDTINNILIDCGINELYPRNIFDAWVYDAVINSDDNLSYYRMIDTKNIFMNQSRSR